MRIPFRKLYEATGFTADADTYCPDCAAERYPAKCTRCGRPGRLGDPGWHDKRECDLHLAYRRVIAALAVGYFGATDREGNEVRPIFLGTEFDYQPHCPDCGAEIDCTVISQEGK